MMKWFSTLLGIGLLASALSAQDFDLPEGKDLPQPQGIHPDTISEHWTYRQSYRLFGGSEAEALAAAKDAFPSEMYRIDEATGFVSSEMRGFAVLRDSAGLIVEMRSTSRYGTGTVEVGGMRVGYDALGRKIVAYTYADALLSQVVDSTFWIWNTPACANEVGVYESWTWSVANGHCSEGLREVRDDPASSWYEISRLKMLWSGNQLQGVLSMTGADTIYREKYTYNATGDLETDSTYYHSLNGWYLSTLKITTYSNRHFVRTTTQGFDMDSSVIFADTSWAGNASTGVRRGVGRRLGIEARFDGAQVQFTNHTAQTVEIQVVSAQGRRQRTLRLRAGQAEGWTPVGPSTFWTANGPEGRVSGTVLTKP